ncbi:16S rRNA (guanine(966)-N(2))-methyltransferase RsmD [Vibrio ruber]|uniref:Ribosomal RNA small subunit methyltransferase D n=1 Tax=Vibrio ruber (strain DSM 16370 / JCM 11486 / BCRC 17186 / CECT 7878 / LMG 23124 / VR1) TaxID=1123498 RepID=A0A1R4LIH5_VIBR1|nr:16S rRNA (guanine(966)-N(2))-methyltransferase RsmD [Vibrio ruber]WNJ96815.1 16S rRNA (guanine(966)-N(2))-methyltransferase RsmD [Vibrio ruber]SJN56315.1 Ribosomal RNA small subunit methyltransferase D [Vibrio ruber DSM 16370]
MGKHRQPNQSQKRDKSGFIRIISGLWKGRKLPVHDAEGLRPTTDRVKETLFNWLATDIPQARCLDLFAGSGSLGFEAASRQAEQVTMIEKNPAAFQQLKKNQDSLSAAQLKIIQSDALVYLAQTPSEKPYDIVFIDPPFRQGLLEETLRLLEHNQWLHEQAMIYIESEKEWPVTAIPASWQLYREKVAGQVCYRLYQKAP